MDIVYIIGTKAHIEELHTLSRDLYLVAFKDKYPNTKTRTQINHVDSFTGAIDPSRVIPLDRTETKDHSDRLDIYRKNDDSSKYLLYYVVDELADKMRPAYYYNLTARTTNGANAALTDNTRAQAEAQGFFTEL